MTKARKVVKLGDRTLEWARTTWPQEEQDLYADWVSRLHGRDGRAFTLEEALRIQGNAYAWHAGWSNAKGFYSQRGAVRT